MSTNANLLGLGRPIAVSLLPAIAIFVVFYATPLIVLSVSAFAIWSGLRFEFVGVDNFVRMFSDDAFWQAAGNTLTYAAAGVLIQVPLGCLVGIILAQRPPGWQFFRAALFLPYLISGAAFALVFAVVYNPRYGLLNNLLGAIGFPTNKDWLFSSDTALIAVALTFVFIIGFSVVLVMAEIASIPQELYEAAQIDGAGPIRRQVSITVPLLRNVIGTLVLLSLIAHLGLFDLVFILTAGGPRDSTLTLVLYGYRAYISGAWGYASAVGVFVVVTGLLLIVGVRRLFRIGEST